MANPFGPALNPFADPVGPGAAGGAGGCPEGFDSFSGSCYYFGSHSSYVTASAKCQEYGAELAPIHDRNLGEFKKYIFFGGNGSVYFPVLEHA